MNRGAFVTIVALLFAPAVESAALDWNMLISADTLELFMNGKTAGTLVQSTQVHCDSGIVRVDRRITIGTSSDDASGMVLVEQRDYGLDGALRLARQEMQGASGASRWHLSKAGAGWRLVMTAGGVERDVPVSSVTENLRVTRLLMDGIKRRRIKGGAVFRDTAFDLTSAQSITTTIRCVETPSRKNGFVWVFSCRNTVVDRDELWRLDTAGKTLYQEVFPFVAKRREGPMGKGMAKERFDLEAITEALAIPVVRSALPGEHIRLVFNGANGPDSSVMRWYQKSGEGWILSGVPQACPQAVAPTPFDSLLLPWTVPTATMQSDAPRIRRIADSLCHARKDRCDSIHACFSFVFHHLEKRFAVAFSNAVETLDAGYGDCGEHAVLLGALLRAARIPARIVLGLVYVPEKKGYYYHAWVMAESRGVWVFVDPALGVFPATRDRIPMVVDDTGREILKIAKIVGNIRVEYEKRDVRRGP